MTSLPVPLASAAAVLVMAVGCGHQSSAGAAGGNDTRPHKATSTVVAALPQGPLTRSECPDARASGVLDYFADTAAESWQEQAARYARTTLRKVHPEATGPQITEQTAEGLEIAYFETSGHRIARLWFRAYRGGWRLETTEECAPSPPSAGSGHY